MERRAGWPARRVLTPASGAAACGQAGHQVLGMMAALVVVLVAGCGGGTAPASAGGSSTSPRPCPTASRGSSPAPSPTGRALACQATTAASTSPSGESVQWTGTIATDTSRAYIENVGGPYSCHDSWTGTLSFQVRANGTLAGSGLFKLGKLSCDFPGGPPQDVASTHAFLVSGSEHASGFTVVLSQKGRQAGIVYAGLSALLSDGVCAGGLGPPIRVPFTGPSRAAGSSHLRVLMHGGCAGSVNDVLTADTTFALLGSGS